MILKLRWLNAIVALALGLGFLVPAPATAANGDQITVISGNFQTIFPAQTFAPLVIKVSNNAGQPIANRSVLFEILSGPGRFSGRTYERMLTGADGRVTMTTLKGTGALGTINFRATADTPSLNFAFSISDTKLSPDNGAQQVVAAGAPFDSVIARFAYSNGTTRSGVTVTFTAVGPVVFEGGGRTASAVTDTYGFANGPDIPGISGPGVGYVIISAPGAPSTGVTLKSVAKLVVTASGSGKTIRVGSGPAVLRVLARDVDGLSVAKHRVTYRVTSGASAAFTVPSNGVCTSSSAGYSDLDVRAKTVSSTTTVALQATSPLMSPVNFTVTVVP